MGNKASSKEKRFKVHIALDFGTDGCALAFAYNDKVSVYNKWKASKRQKVEKTKTQILLNEKDKIVSFGNYATTMFCGLSGNERKSWKFIDKFKMSLYGEKSSHIHIEENDEEKKISKTHQFNTDIMDYLTAINGARVPAEICFVETFKHLGAICIDYLDKLTKNDNIKEDEIQFIFTVPSLWSEASKYKMKQWIVKSGLINKRNMDQCKMVYEPECAALAIRYDTSIQKPCINDKYILIDAGAGTVDIVCHTMKRNQQCTEFHSASGDKWGGCHVDNAYIILLRHLFGEKCITEFQLNSPNIYLEIINNFQTAKHSFFENEDNETHSVQLPYEFVQYLCETQHNVDVETKIAQFLSSDYLRALCIQKPDVSEMEQKEPIFMMNTEDEILVMDVCIWKALFDSVVNIIIAHVKQLMAMREDDILNDHKICESVEYIYLCGGFATSKYLQYKMETAFGMESKYKKKVIIPAYPTLSVVKGAAYFGQLLQENKHYVIQRKLQYTYAVKSSVTVSYAKLQQFDETYVKQNTFEDKDKIKYVANCWKIVARKGQMVAVDGPLKPGTMIIRDRIRKKWKAQILSSDKTDPRTSDDFKVLATIQIPTADIKHDVDLFNFYFGETMLRIEVHAGFSGKIQKMEINYN